MRVEEIVGRLRERAALCRKLAEGASDPDAADTLQKMAEDIDLAIPLLEATPAKS
jgi:hypothetical protein